MLLVVVVGLVACGCAHPARGGASDPGFADAAQGQTSGHAPSDTHDYRQVLADPGPF